MLGSESQQTINAVKRVIPSVVEILMTKHLSEIKEGKDLRSLGLVDEKGMVKLSGCSGFFISSEGYIITNRHVVEDESASYSVAWKGQQFKGSVVLRDIETDIAIVKIEGNHFPVALLGNSSRLQLGETVVAIGNSLGEFTNTVSRGVISGLSRHILAGASTPLNKGQNFFHLIQTDAAINPGNSGGPLINLKGEVIGVCTAMILGVENMGFATPINQAAKVWKQFRFPNN